ERAMRLQRMAKTPVKIVFIPLAAPEWHVPDSDLLHHEPCDGAVKLAHHLAELFRIFHVADEVIMVIHHRRDPRDESVELCVIVETVPEDLLCWFRVECSESVPHF